MTVKGNVSSQFINLFDDFIHLFLHGLALFDKVCNRYADRLTTRSKGIVVWVGNNVLDDKQIVFVLHVRVQEVGGIALNIGIIAAYYPFGLSPLNKSRVVVVRGKNGPSSLWARSNPGRKSGSSAEKKIY